MRYLLLCLILLSGGCLDFPPHPDPSPTPPPTPSPVVPIDNAVVLAFEGDVELAEEIRQLAYEFSILVGRDVDVVKTTADIRQGWSRAGTLAIDRSSRKTHPGLAESIDSVLFRSLGKKNITLNPDLRQQAVRAFQIISASAAEVRG